MLVIFSGLPGTGKSTLADAAAALLGCPLFSKDTLEATLRRSGIGADAGSGFAAYELLTMLATEQLQRRQSVVLDSVATFARLRAAWRTLAEVHAAPVRVVECICSDEAAHRERLRHRVRAIPGWYEVPWAEVEQIRGRYEPWAEPHLILDAVAPLERNLADLQAYLLS